LKLYRRQRRFELLQAAEGQRSSLDQMMWQVPALSLTAQSFLLQLALGATTRWPSRLLAGMLGLVAALAAIQLLLKHRFYEELHSFWLERVARRDDQAAGLRWIAPDHHPGA
jgi:hypothetical protein